MLRRSLIVLASVGVLGLAACGGGDGNGGDGTGDCTASDTNLCIAAEGLAFDTATLSAPADTEFTITFTNNDSISHNIAVTPAAGGDAAFEGEIFGGPATQTYDVPALAAGDYAFLCQVHPTQMTGTLTAG